MKTRGILEVQNSGDEWGEICGRVTVAQCSDCGANIHAEHSETCEKRKLKFCESCISSHLADYAKPIHRVRPHQCARVHEAASRVAFFFRRAPNAWREIRGPWTEPLSPPTGREPCILLRDTGRFPCVVLSSRNHERFEAIATGKSHSAARSNRFNNQG